MKVVTSVLADVGILPTAANIVAPAEPLAYVCGTESAIEKGISRVVFPDVALFRLNTLPTSFVPRKVNV